ncbi:unnamed protein product [Euphydryas editha]|uniref:Uncharacterized protein n=1 Tax=Euphydryas editha TaxID=104508 RepID=A0AAU9VB59_EUPED|nr:unnamed protein product [Euphydryas editha]
MRSVSKGTRGGSQRTALMSARGLREGLLTAFGCCGSYARAAPRGRRARWQRSERIMQRSSPTCPTSSREARRTKPTPRYAGRPKCTFTTPRMQSTYIFASRSDKRIDDESGP